MVGYVDERAGAIVHPIAIGSSPLVGHLESGHGQKTLLESAGFGVEEAPISPQFLGPDRKQWRRHQAGHQTLGARALGGEVEFDPGVGMIEGRAERKPLDVVLVEVG